MYDDISFFYHEISLYVFVIYEDISIKLYSVCNYVVCYRVFRFKQS